VLIPVSGHQLCHAPFPPILIGVNTSIPKKSWWMMLRWPWNFPFYSPCIYHLPGSRDHLKMAQQLFQLVGVSWPWRATWDPLGPLGSQDFGVQKHQSSFHWFMSPCYCCSQWYLQSAASWILAWNHGFIPLYPATFVDHMDKFKRILILVPH
jgi:hypothetical protein